jgi:four helix bundle protein
MRYKRFEDLPVWNAAIDLGAAIFSFTARSEFTARHALRDQIERAAVSVSNNIAEGFERGTNKELLMFLYIARGSAGEVRSMLCLLERLSAFAELSAGINALKACAESCSKQLKAWAESLQNSTLRGERYVNDNVRQADRKSREREEFLKDLSDVRNKSSKPN